MPKCSICEQEVDELFTCKHCNAQFCENCGDKEAETCVDCSESDIETRREGEKDIIDDLQEMEQAED